MEKILNLSVLVIQCCLLFVHTSFNDAKFNNLNSIEETQSCDRVLTISGFSNDPGKLKAPNNSFLERKKQVWRLNKSREKTKIALDIC